MLAGWFPRWKVALTQPPKKKHKPERQGNKVGMLVKGCPSLACLELLGEKKKSGGAMKGGYEGQLFSGIPTY